MPFGGLTQFGVAEIWDFREEFRTGKISVRLKFTGLEVAPARNVELLKSATPKLALSKKAL